MQPCARNYWHRAQREAPGTHVHTWHGIFWQRRRETDILVLQVALVRARNRETNGILCSRSDRCVLCRITREIRDHLRLAVWRKRNDARRNQDACVIIDIHGWKTPHTTKPSRSCIVLLLLVLYHCIAARRDRR